MFPANRWGNLCGGTPCSFPLREVTLSHTILPFLLLIISLPHLLSCNLPTHFVQLPGVPLYLIDGMNQLIKPIRFLKFSQSNFNTAFKPIAACVRGRSPHTQRFSNNSWMSYESTQFWYYLPRDSTRFYRLWAPVPQDGPSLPALDDSHSLRFLPVLLTNHL